MSDNGGPDRRAWRFVEIIKRDGVGPAAAGPAGAHGLGDGQRHRGRRDDGKYGHHVPGDAGDETASAHQLLYPLSRDLAKAVALKNDLALDRLAFGQPRQEDLLDFLKRRGVGSAGAAIIDLRPDAIRNGSSESPDGKSS